MLVRAMSSSTRAIFGKVVTENGEATRVGGWVQKKRQELKDEWALGQLGVPSPKGSIEAQVSALSPKARAQYEAFLLEEMAK